MKDLYHERSFVTGHGLVSVTVTLETRDYGHFRDVKSALQKAKIRYAVQESIAFDETESFNHSELSNFEPSE